MADQKVGGVYYEVAADTSGVIQMGAVVDKTTSSIQSDFKQTDKVINQASSGIQTSMTKTASAVQKTQSSFGGLRGVAGNLGFQLQDIAVQAQAGTSAFVILGQQGSQVASAFGPGGAVLGAVIAVAAAIGGTLVASIKAAKKEAETLPEDVKAKIEEIGKKFENVDLSSRTDLAKSELGKLTTQYEETLNQITELEAKLKDLDTFGPSSKFVKGGEQYTKVWRETNFALKDSKTELGNLKLILDGVQEVTTNGLATESIDGFKSGVTDASTAAKSLLVQLQAATIRLTEGELAARRFAAAQILGLKNAEMLPPEIQIAIDNLFKLEEAEKRSVEQKKRALEEQRKLTSEQKEYQKAVEDSFLAELKAEQDQRRTVTTEFQQVATSAATDLESPAQRAERELSERLAVINRYAQQEYADKEAALTAQLDAEQAYSEKVKAIKQTEDDFRNKQNMNTLSTVGDFFGNLASIAEKGGEKQFKAWKLLASAQAGISAALAVLAVLADQSIQPTGLRIGLAGSMAALAGAQIAQIQSAQYSGGRMYGGPVSAGNVYQVGENNSPELLKQGNKQYLIPGNRGSVTSNADMNSGGGMNVSVNVQNYSGQPVDVQRGQTGSGTNAQEVINIVVGNINQRGQIHQSIVRSTTAGNRTT